MANYGEISTLVNRFQALEKKMNYNLMSDDEADICFKLNGIINLFITSPKYEQLRIEDKQIREVKSKLVKLETQLNAIKNNMQSNSLRDFDDAILLLKALEIEEGNLNLNFATEPQMIA